LELYKYIYFRYRIAELAPHLLKYDYVEPTVFSEVAMRPTKENTLLNTPILDYIDVNFLKNLNKLIF